MHTNEQNYNKVQAKTFAKWINNKLSLKNHKDTTFNKEKYLSLPSRNRNTVNDLFTDLNDGVILRNLLEVLSNEVDVINITNTPITRIQSLENISLILEYLKRKNLKFVNIGSVDIYEKNERIILGLVWTIILRFAIHKNSTFDDASFPTNDSLLNWCQAATAHYDNVEIKNFSHSWVDGLAFNAIIHRFKPELIDYKSMSKKEAEKNLENAFSVAESQLGIPRLLDIEDIHNVVKPDEKSVMTYVSMFREKFGDHKLDHAKKAENFLKHYEETQKFENELNLEISNFQTLFDKITTNNLEYKKNISNIQKLFVRNCSLVKELRNLKYKIYQKIGVINSIKNFYNLKIKQYENEELLRNVVQNEIKRCFSCLNIIEEHKEGAYSVDEAVQKALLDDTAFENQIIILEKMKASATDPFIKDLFSQKIERLTNVFRLFDSKKVLKEALEMFRRIDKSESGFISTSAAVEIYKILGVYSESVDKMLANKKEIETEEFIRLTHNLYLESFDVSHLAHELSRICGDDLTYQIVEKK